MATLVNKMNREVKVIIPNMREFSTFYSDNEGVIGMFFKRDWAEETTKKEEPVCLDDGGAPNSQKCGDCTIACDAKVEEDRDVVFWKGMQHAIAGMKKDAVEGVIIDSGFDDGTAFVTMNIPDRRYDRGDRVKLIIIKDDGKSD